MDWNEYYFSLLDVVKTKSKDPSTQVGSVIVGKNHEVRSLGFNGFPRGVRDKIEDVPERFERPTKYAFFEHSERNNIYNAARLGIPLEGCTIYVPWIPCCDCARAIIQCGISRIVIDGRDFEKTKSYWEERWGESMNYSLLMIQESGTILEYYKDGQLHTYTNKEENNEEIWNTKS